MDDLRKETADTLRDRPGKDNILVVAATVQGLKTKQVIETARVPLYLDQTLAKTLHDLGIGVEIPPRLYEAVDRILVFVAGLDKKASR